MKKVKDYLIELSLIVVGVLIAISVDDYREKSKTDEMLQSYIDVMKNDLRENLRLLEDEIYYDSIALDRLALMVDKLGRQDYSGIDSLARYLTEHSSFTVNDTGFRMIMQSGNSHKMETDKLARLNNLFGASMTDLNFFQSADLNNMRLAMTFFMKHHMRIQELLTQGRTDLATELTNLAFSRMITMRAEREEKKKFRTKVMEIVEGY